ncbi:MAG: AsmA-like C-terminal domain-containing protein [Alphaproteobacteria bacterium]|nr:AsmA-like C-terminal domain-containing protein [Alphaproteobacteria bacterium]
MKKSYYIRKILDYLGVTFLLALAVFLWKLYQGPIGVPFLKPYIIEALHSGQNEYTVDIGEVNIELVHSIQPVKIIAKNVVLKKNDDTVSVKTKKLFLSFSIRALLQGMIAPSSILIKNPEVSIFTTYGVEKNKENEINRKKIEYYTDWFNGFLERFHSKDKLYPESFINEIDIQNASIEFHEVDLGKKWQFSNANLSFERALTSLKLSANGVVDLDERMATLSSSARYDFVKKDIILDVKFADVVISDFIKQIGGGISSIDIPLEGEIKSRIDFAKIIENPEDLTDHIDAAFEQTDFNFKGTEGKVVFEDNAHFDYKIDSFELSGEIKGGLDHVILNKTVLKTGGQQVDLDVSLEGYKKYFLEKSLEDFKLILQAKAEKLAMDDLAKFWPRYYGEPAWLWCKENLYGGTYQNAAFDFEWAYDKDLKAVTLMRLNGKADLDDGTVYYLEGMPEVTNVYGQAYFDIGVIDIILDKGVSDGILLDSGRVKIYDLDKYNNFIDITIKGDTSIKDALAYIDHEPLEFAKDLGLNGNMLEGDVNVDLNLNFELYQDLKPEDIKVKTTAVLRDVIFKDVFDGKDLKSSKVDLKITEKGLSANGHALFDEIPVQFDYMLVFGAESPQGKGHFAFTYDDNVAKKLGVYHALLEAPYVTGYAFVNADLISNDNQTKIDIIADLRHMAIDYGFLGFQKNADEDGQIKAKLDLKNAKPVSVPFFELKRDNFNIQGNVALDAKGEIKTIDISKIEGPKTSAAAKIEFLNAPKKHIKLNVSGNSYDLTELFARNEEAQKEKSKTQTVGNDDDGLETMPDTDIFVAVGNLWTNPETPIKNFAGSAIIKNGIGFEEVHLIGNYGTDKSIMFNLEYMPRPNGEHFLTIESNNAGSTLRVLRLYENMNGGNLKIEARRDKYKKFIGHAKIRDFKITNTPLLAKLLTVASFSGMLDLLKGDGLVFSHFDAPFTYQNKTLKINDAKMFGNVIGLTATGSVNRLSENIDIRGVISPAYSLNSMVGKIPLLGKMLVGKDGTVFAADYSITDTIDDPKIEINPLSLLSPNSVKDLFSSEP